jgi:hypothetical protein
MDRVSLAVDTDEMAGHGAPLGGVASGGGVLAEAIQIDGGVIALFLLVLVVIACAYLAYAIVGYRLAARAAQAEAGSGAWAVLFGLAAFDVLLVVWALGVMVRDASNFTALMLLVAPAAHGAGYLRGRTRARPPSRD